MTPQQRIILFSRPAWTPLQLGASLLGWWTADRSDLITLATDKVTSWKDVVAGYDLIQGTSGRRPVYSAIGFNGAACVIFDGIDDYLNMESQPFPSGNTPSEVWALGSQDALVADTASHTLVDYGGPSSATTRTVSRFVSTMNRAFAAAGNGLTSLGTSPSTVDYSGVAVTRSIFAASAVNIIVDGVSASPQLVVPATGTTRFRLGANVSLGGSSPYWVGKVREIVIVSALADAQAAQLTKYLMNRRML